MALLDFDTFVAGRAESVKPEHANGYRTNTHDMSLALAGFQLRRTHVKRTRVPEEQPLKIREAAVTARTALAAKRAATLDKLQDMIATDRAAALAKVAAGGTKEDAVLRFMRQAEIRSRLIGLEDFKISAMLRQATERGDQDFLSAVREAPKMFPVVDPEVLRELDNRAVAALNPALADLEALASAYQCAFDAADETIAAALREDRVAPAGTEGITTL